MNGDPFLRYMNSNPLFDIFDNKQPFNIQSGVFVKI